MKDVSGPAVETTTTTDHSGGEDEVEEVNDGSINQSESNSASSLSSDTGSLLELPELVLDRSYEATSSPDALVDRDPLPAALAAASAQSASTGTNSSSGHSGRNGHNNNNNSDDGVKNRPAARRRLSFRDIFLLPLRAGRRRRRSASANFEEPSVNSRKSRKQSGCAGWLDITKRWKSPTRSNTSSSCDDLPALVPVSELYGRYEPLRCSRCGQDDSCQSDAKHAGATYTKRPAGVIRGDSVESDSSNDLWLCAPCLREERRFSSSSSSSSTSSSWADDGSSRAPSVAHLARLAMDALLKSCVSLLSVVYRGEADGKRSAERDTTAAPLHLDPRPRYTHIHSFIVHLRVMKRLFSI